MARKRINKLDLETILVGSGDQALASGTKVTTGTAYNIADGQLGVLSREHGGARDYGNFLQAGDTVTSGANVITITQGTPNSTQTNLADPWEVTDKDIVESTKILAGKIRSVTTKLYEVPKYSLEYYNTFATVLANQDYMIQTTLDSVRNDRDYGDNDELVTSTFTTTNSTALAAINNALDYLLMNLLYKYNLQSTLNAIGNQGNKPVIALGINTAGGAGQVINTITAGTSIDVQTDGTLTTSIVADSTLVNTLNEAVSGALAGTATIEVIDLSVAGTNATLLGNQAIDSFIILGLDEAQAVYFDNIKFTKVRTRTTVGDGFLLDTAPSKTVTVYPFEGSNSGRDWTIENDNRARLQVHTMQNSPAGEFFSQGKTYVDSAQPYTATIIDYYDEEETLTVTPQQPKQVIILLPASISNPTAAVSVGYTVATDDTATVVSLNAILGAWLTSERAISQHEIKGDATAGTYFV